MPGREQQIAIALNAALSTILLLGTGHVAQAQAVAVAEKTIDDGWRRTASGWERISAWQLKTDVVPAPRVDFHPAGLAALQAMLVFAAFRFFTDKSCLAGNATPAAG